MEKTSLEKSHSKWSNTKLTALCVIATISVSAFWTFFGLKDYLNQVFFYIALGITAVLSLLSLLFFNKFKR